MKLWFVLLHAMAGTSLLGGATACASSADEKAKPRFEPIGSGGSWDEESYGGEAGEPSWGEGGAAGAAGETWGETGGESGGGSWEPDPGVGGSDPGAGLGGGSSTPVNAPGCGANGNSCCATGDTCADPKAQCCFECSGTPDYLCHCQTGYHDPGLCRVCCVVCNNGKVKAEPLYVSGSSCQEAAQAWCKSTFGVGADTKSGWRAKCG